MPNAQATFVRTRASSSHRVSTKGSTARGSPSRPSASAAFHRVPSLSSESFSTRISRVFDVTCHLHPAVDCSYVVHGVRRRFCQVIRSSRNLILRRKESPPERWPGAMTPAAPDGAPPRRINYLMVLEQIICPARARRGARATPSVSEGEGRNRNYQDPIRSCRRIILERREVENRKTGIMRKIFQRNVERIQVPYEK